MQVMTRTIAPSLRQQYLKNGIAFPIPVLSAEEVQRFRAASDQLEIQLGGKPRTVEVRQMHLHFPGPMRWPLSSRVGRRRRRARAEPADLGHGAVHQAPP